MKARGEAQAVVLATWLALESLGCGGNARRGAENSALPAGAIARAGSELVSPSTISRIAAAQGVAARAALELAVSDALFAHAARAELGPASARSIERAAAARALLQQMYAEAAKSGPPSSAELAKIVQERWVELNRPDAVRTTHAVVMNDKPARDAAAHAVADKLAAALANVQSESELIRVASAFPGEGFEIRAEALPFVTADGRVLERRDATFVSKPGAFDVDFAKAANAIAEPGQLTAAVKSAFGYHVIRLEERALGSVVPEAELPSLVEEEVRQRRAKRARRELIERLRAASTIQVERAAEQLTTQVKVAP
jgi:parvulin-like peptidyl-prolyl isomerase